MSKIFSGTVAVAFFAYMVWFFMPYGWGYIYDYDVLTGLRWANFGSKIDIDGPVPYLVGFLYVAAYIGLLVYKQWARTLFLVLALFGVISSPFWGLGVQGNYDVMVGSIVTYCDGAIIAMSYLTSVSVRFTENA